jgi:hypothetical protein
MAKKIHFSRYDESKGLYPPVPSNKLLPDWYKKAKSYLNDEKKPRIDEAYVTIKRCVPVFDSITAGYLILLNKDMYCEQTPSGPYFHWRTDGEKDTSTMITQHSKFQAQSHPDNNLGHQLKIENPWIIKTDPGYSCMILPPMHRDNEIIILPAVVDTDLFYEKINFPFNLKNKNFEGLIEAGTPIAQIIPFKRESYQMKVSELDKNRSTISQKIIASKLFDSYRNSYWSRKEYK